MYVSVCVRVYVCVCVCVLAFAKMATGFPLPVPVTCNNGFAALPFSILTSGIQTALVTSFGSWDSSKHATEI